MEIDKINYQIVTITIRREGLFYVIWEQYFD